MLNVPALALKALPVEGLEETSFHVPPASSPVNKLANEMVSGSLLQTSSAAGVPATFDLTTVSVRSTLSGHPGVGVLTT